MPANNRAKTHSQLILEHMQANQKISTWQAYETYRITCLAQRIFDLRRQGYNIESELVTVDGKTFSNYWLAN